MAEFHLVGVGGAGMSVVAELLAAAGHRVTGSDQRDSAVLGRLRAAGVDAVPGHDPARVPPGAAVVVSTAVRADNPELRAARARGQRVIHRSQALALAAAGRDFVAVAGAHGKTTTSAMLAVALRAAGRDPSFAIGGVVRDLGTGAHLGAGPELVAEADESDGSFLNYAPRVAVVTNVEPDHLDHYGSREAFARAFEEFAARIVPGGLLVACADDAGARALAQHAADAGTRVVTYGSGPSGVEGAEGHAALGAPALTGASAAAPLRWLPAGLEVPLELAVGGQHNLLNAAGAWAAGVELGVDPAAMARGLAAFTGTGRRFEPRGEARGVRVVDDYAHHPTEIAATLRTARLAAGDGRVLALFQPHLYSRTAAFADRFAAALDAADVVVVTDVYAAREEPVPGVDGSVVTAHMAHGRYVADRVEAARTVADLARPGDLVLTIGAGDVTELPPLVLARLEERA